jgi:hypothetical protein
MKVYLVWNKAKNECVGFLNEDDAQWTASIGDHPLPGIGTPTLGEDFINSYADDLDEGETFPLTEVEVLP